MSSVWRGGGRVGGGGGTTPVVRSRTHAGRTKTEIYQTVKMTSDFNLNLPEKVM